MSIKFFVSMMVLTTVFVFWEVAQSATWKLIDANNRETITSFQETINTPDYSVKR